MGRSSVSGVSATDPQPVPQSASAPSRDGWWRVLYEPTVLILIAAGIVHIIRRNQFDILVFFGTAAFIVVDRLRRPPEVAMIPPARHTARQQVLIAAVLALYSVVAGQWEVDTWPMRAAMIIPGLLFVVVLAVRPPAEDAAASSMGRGWIAWAALAVAIALWELTSFVQQPNPIDDSYEHPTISAIVTPWLAHWPARAIFLLLWVAAGYWLIRTIAAARPAPTSESTAPPAGAVEVDAHVQADAQGDFR